MRLGSARRRDAAEHLFSHQSMAGFRVVAISTKGKKRKWIAVRLEHAIDIDDRDAQTAYQLQHLTAFGFSPRRIARIPGPFRKIYEQELTIPAFHATLRLAQDLSKCCHIRLFEVGS